MFQPETARQSCGVYSGREILSSSRGWLKSLCQYNDLMQFILNKHMNNWTCAALNLLLCGKHLHSDYYSLIGIHTLFGKHLCWHLELSAEHNAVQSWLSVWGKAVVAANNRFNRFFSFLFLCVEITPWPECIYILVTRQQDPKHSAPCRVLSLCIFWLYIYILVCVYLMNYIWLIYKAAPLNHEYIHNIIVFAQNGA